MTEGRQLRALFFDLDGTLTETWRLWWRLWRITLGDHVGRRYTDEELSALVGPTEPRIFLNEVGNIAARIALEDFIRLYKTALREQVRPQPQVHALLRRALDDGMVTSLVSWHMGRITSPTLVQLGLTEYFLATVSGEDAHEAPPPGPEIFVRALERLGVQAKHSLFIGSHAALIGAARTAGLWTAQACWSAASPIVGEGCQADLRFSAPTELARYLNIA